MSTTRRTFIRQALTFGSASICLWIETQNALAQGGVECTLPSHEGATRLVPNEPKVMTRFSAAEMALPEKASQLAKLRDAFCKIQKLPDTDVIGWKKQIAQHCLECAPSNPTNIHFSAYFLPWHRGLLYCLERILRNLAEDDDLRLCYWNWENPSSRTVPSIYAEANQCLFYENRNFQGLTDDDVDVAPLLAIKTYGSFGGGAPRHTGAAFGGPHANVHNAFNGDMGDLQFSPRDPVFYAHHGNIDRLWSSWNKAGRVNPDFGNDKVYFYDENRKLRFIMLNDLRDEAKLGYRYSSYMSSRVNLANLERFSLAKTSATAFALESTLKNRIANKQSKDRFLVVQNIQNLDKLPADANTFGIFSDHPSPGSISAEDKGFLGKVARVRSSAAHQNGPLTAALTVTKTLPQLVTRNQGVVQLTIAPLDRSGKVTAPGIPVAAESIIVVE